MSRVIKFRAWVKSGDYSEMMENVHNHIGAVTGFGHLLQNTAKGIDECRVMQFTGLLDANGVEVYEGDVVSVSDTGAAEVKICPAYGVVFSDAEGFERPFIDCAEKGDWPTVIGNIYQNQELLSCVD